MTILKIERERPLSKGAGFSLLVQPGSARENVKALIRCESLKFYIKCI